MVDTRGNILIKDIKQVNLILNTEQTQEVDE